MEIQIDSIRPGILVAGKVSLKGGVSYIREHSAPLLEDGKLTREWHTVAIVEDIDEKNEADRVRSKIYSSLRRVCVNTSIGLICPSERRDDLRRVLDEINTERQEFNYKAKTCNLQMHYAFFEVKEDNSETLSAIADQIQEAFRQVNQAIEMEDTKALNLAPKRFLNNMSPESILTLPEKQRDAIMARVRAELIRSSVCEVGKLNKILPASAEKEFNQTISSVKRIAKSIRVRVEKRNDSLSKVLNEVDTSGINKSRIAFMQVARKARQMKPLAQTEQEQTTSILG